MPKNDVNLISQVKMYASSQLAEQWAQRWNGEMSPDLFTESEMRLISPLSPPQYSSMSPMYDDDNDFDPSQAQHIDDSTNLPPVIIDKRHRRDSDNVAQYLPWYTSPQYIEPSPTSLAVDENDGPTSFNLSPSSPPALLGFTGQKLIKKLNKRNVKRKLFE
ncbi:hypothetical protein QTP88_009377 [Uroleucon formosanum]